MVAFHTKSEKNLEKSLWAVMSKKIFLGLAPIDWVAICFLAYVWIAVAIGETGPSKSHFLVYVTSVLAITVVLLWWFVRNQPLGPIGERLYHVLPLCSGCAIYFRLREIFPFVHPHLLDAKLHALDRFLFGTDLSVWMEAWTTSSMVEWFSFFYWLYFPMIIVGTAWALLVATDRQARTRMATGTSVAVFGGVSVYFLVPGIGPWHYLEAAYQAPLQGGAFHEWIWALYAHGAGRDIFPSVHTAMCLWYCLFLFRERTIFHFKWRHVPWFVCAFVSVNVIVSTIVLRWHYAVDLVAGVMLTLACYVVAYPFLDWYEAKRARAGVQVTYW